jgi:hypothetical protein
LALLNKATIQNALRKYGLSSSGRKAELVVRVIQNGIVKFTEDEILSFLESRNEDDFSAYRELLLCIEQVSRFDRSARLLVKATEENLAVFVKHFRSGNDFANSAGALVPLLVRQSGDIPCFVAFVLEGLIDAEGTVAPVRAAIYGMSDELMARQRRIKKSFERHARLSHPAVDSLLQQVWSGEFKQHLSLLEGVRKEVRSGSRNIEAAMQELRDPTQGATLNDVNQRTSRIESRTEAIQRGVQTLQDQLRDVHQEIKLSPDRVANALEKLVKTRDVKWGTRRRIGRDLERFWTLTDHAQKIEFLGKAIFTYGPVVISALRGLL